MKLHQSLYNFASIKEIYEIHLHINNVDRHYLNKNLLARLMLKSKWIGYHHFCNLSVVGNDKSISKQNIQDKNVCKISNFVIQEISHDLLTAEVYSLRFHLKLWIMQITWFRLKSFSETSKLPSYEPILRMNP